MKNQSSAAKTTSKNVWIFQAVPEHYDLLIEVPKRLGRARASDRWSVTRYGDEMRIGDHLLLWRSGQNAGIYATGRIISLPYSERGDRWVDVKFNPLLERPVLKETLLKRSNLKNLSILRVARGTNFAVTWAEWKELKMMIGEEQSESFREVAQERMNAPLFDPKNLRDARKRIVASIVQRQGQPEFRRKLLRIYSGKCVVSNCDAEAALEAAHISAYRGARTDNPRNGLLLRSDLHTLFDLYLISIDAARGRLLLAPSLRRTCYEALNGQRVGLPKNGPSKAALNQHRAEFFRRQRPSE